ncbi:Uncharacterised protein [Klebsiella pneumoniae]|nr:Uncharacterised protein [Klebsiella pneumoniae]
MLVETFMAQLPEAPSQMMPLTSPIMLLIAMAMVSKLPFINQIIPAAAPIPAVVVAHRADRRGSLQWI